MELCCGGILGMGETLEQRIDFAFELAALEPCEVPINLLDPRPGTPLGDSTLLAPREALQAIALFRLVLPSAWIRLAGGRERVLGELQAMGLLAGAQRADRRQLPHHHRSIAPRTISRSLDALGMPVADGPGEGRFVVDADGAHARPAQPARTTIPVRAESLHVGGAQPTRPHENSRRGSREVEVVLADEEPAHHQPDEFLDHHHPCRGQQRVVRERTAEERPPEQLVVR